MRTLSLLVCLAFLMPGVALAQEDAEPPMSEPAPAQESTVQSRPFSAVRLAAEVLGGALLGAGFESLGSQAGETMLCTPGRFLSCMLSRQFGGGVGRVLGVPLGVWGGGELTGGNGSLLATFGGSVVGTMVAIGAATFITRFLDNYWVSMGSSLILHLGCTVLGYELSEAGEVPSSGATGSTLQPLVAVSSGGAVLGLGGRF